ncbi:hypothetical protein B0O99DRAFT_681159 [Bisporella sp. PMI_857]|nr:hypothetical protein B0O99DRAFT_681159 [Bisporella sp. PMI_857]
MERKVIDPQLESQASLPRLEKLELLRKLLNDKLVVEEAVVVPNTLIDADNQVWRGLISAIGSTYRLEGNKTEELKHLKLFNAHTTGLPNTHYLAALLEETGQYDEAIELARPITTNHDAKLGPDSPQAHGSRRTLAKALWKQGKREEAETVIKEIQENIKASASGKYAAYQVEEQRILDDFVNELQAWKPSA